jgi:hypothetical protein
MVTCAQLSVGPFKYRTRRVRLLALLVEQLGREFDTMCSNKVWLSIKKITASWSVLWKNCSGWFVCRGIKNYIFWFSLIESEERTWTNWFLGRCVATHQLTVLGPVMTSLSTVKFNQNRVSYLLKKTGSFTGFIYSKKAATVISFPVLIRLWHFLLACKWFVFSLCWSCLLKNIFEWCIQIILKVKISSHCAPQRNHGLIAEFEEGTSACSKLHATCIVRLPDISLM